jgi:TatD DNase family protein
MLSILEEAKRKHGSKLRGNAHFFVGNIDIAKRFVDIGFTMSFSGVITFTKDYDDVVRFLPSTMILAETDSPYATPAPFRGERNSPMYVQEVVAKIAVLRNEPLEETRTQLLENVKRVFDLTF